jgi:hypothetical protein
VFASWPEYLIVYLAEDGYNCRDLTDALWKVAANDQPVALATLGAELNIGGVHDLVDGEDAAHLEPLDPAEDDDEPPAEDDDEPPAAPPPPPAETPDELNPRQERRMRKMYKGGLSVRCLARRFNVTERCVRDVLVMNRNDRNWFWLMPEDEEALAQDREARRQDAEALAQEEAATLNDWQRRAIRTRHTAGRRSVCRLARRFKVSADCIEAVLAGPMPSEPAAG